MTRLRRIIVRTPGPPWLIAAFLAVRWRCRVSPAARIRHPFKLTLGRGVRIGRATIVASGRGVELGDRVEIGDGAVLDAQTGRIAVGPGSAIGPFVVVYGEGTVCMGSDVAIAAHSTVVAADHGFDDLGVPIRRQPSRAAGIRIEDDVWIAANSVVLDGVTIGVGSVVAAGAVATRSVEPYTVVAGVPARLIRHRAATPAAR